MTRPLTIAFIAGETSGDQLGGWLIAALRAKSPQAHIIGLGGPMMEAQGLKSIFPMQEIALIGMAEVLPHLRTITRRIREMVAFIEREQPDIVVSIDSPGFVLRVVKKLRARGVTRPKYIHYVAPTVWAYRPERAKIMAERFDHLLCLLPFEPPYFEAEKLPTSFIGHEIAWWWKTRGDGQAFRQIHNLGDAPLLAVFPGSRQGEINRLWPVFKQSIERLKDGLPNLQVAIQVPTALLPRMQRETKDWSVPYLLLSNTEDKKGLFAAATAAIAKSGTIGLECALAGLPSIIAYRASALTAYMLRRLITVQFVNLANLLAGRMIIPELIQENCTPEKIVQAVQPLLMDAHAREAQQRDLRDVAAMLGVNDSQSPSEKAAEIILKQLH
jgi:lipid-A-disaccharide synthase